MSKEKDFYAKVAEKLIEKLKAGTAPWQIPWEKTESHGLPVNLSTGKKYRGGNMILLLAQDYEDNRWLTYKQAEAMGAQVRRGEQGTPIIYWKFDEQQKVRDENNEVVKGENGKPLTTSVELERPRAFLSYVFNAKQIDGLPELVRKEATWKPEQRAEELLSKSGAKIEHQPQNRAYYSLYSDKIVLPEKGQFKSATGYYDTALHELGHWTGHPDRLDRGMGGPRGSVEYAKEELVAEISSMMLSQELGIPHDVDNHAAYVQSWIKALEDDPKEIFRAASKAEAVLEYVMAFEQTRELAQEVGQVVGQNVQAGQTRKNGHDLIVKPDAKAQEQNMALPAEKKAREYLNVPYMEHRQAKAAGARWDGIARKWYLGEKPDMEKLAKYLPENKPGQRPDLSPGEAFAETLRNLGCVVDGEHPIMDGKSHRIATVDDKAGERSGFYVVHSDGKPAGYIKNNRTGEEIRWKYQGKELTLQEQEGMKEAYTARKIERASELQKIHEATVQRIAQECARLARVEQATPYLLDKGIKVQPGIFDKNGTTCVPAQDAEGKIWTMQYIQEDVTKRFAKDGRKEGCFHPVGGMDAVLRAPAIVIGEGYATACSLADQLGFGVVAAFDAGNLGHVAEALHKKYPDKPIIIAGDDDRHLASNPGKTMAEQAAQRVGGLTVFPVFATDETGKNFKDFNDLAVKSRLGSEAVGRQVKPVIDKAMSRLVELRRQKEQQQTIGQSR